jgi:hypothetical protein
VIFEALLEQLSMLLGDRNFGRRQTDPKTLDEAQSLFCRELEDLLFT